MSPSASADVAAVVPRMIHIRDINPNPWQPRGKIDQGKLKGLVNSIKRYGFTGYVEVRPDPTFPAVKYQLVFGHRRMQAARLAGLSEIPAIVRDYSDKEMAELALLENSTQEEMTYYDQAMALRRIMDEHGYSIRDLNEVFGFSRGYVTNRLEIARLPPDSPMVQAAKSGQADMTTIQTLAKLSNYLEDAEIGELLQAAVKGDIKAHQLKALREALEQAQSEQNPHFDEYGREIIRVEMPRQQGAIDITALEASRRAKEEAYAALLARERAGEPVTHIDTIGLRTSVLPKDDLEIEELPMAPVPEPMWTVVKPRFSSAEEAARLAIAQLRENIKYLRQKLTTADMESLSDEERREWNQLKEEMIALLG